MLRLFFLALVFWMSLFEAVAALLRWQGLALLGKRLRGTSAFVLPWSVSRLRRAGLQSVAALALALLPALVLHLVLSSMRNWQLNPRRRLLPGRFADRQISRIDIPTAAGPVPTLYIVPTGGTHAAVCVAHGSGCNKTFYAWGLVDALLAQGMAVMLVDLDGHGESPRAQAFPAILHSVSGPVNWLRQRYMRVGVIGISLGGCVAARAVADGAAADALVVLEAPPRLHLTRRQVVREALYLFRPGVLHLLRDGSLYHIIRAWESPPIRADISTWDLIEQLDLIGSLQRMTADSSSGSSAVPLLLIYGGSDAIVPLAQAEAVRRAVPASVAFHSLPRASHLSLPIEPRTLALVSTWLAKQLLSACHQPKTGL